MRLVFMGTPEFAVPVLKSLIAAGHEIVAVYTRPPRPAGRGYAERRSPVHQFASAQTIPVRTPATLKGPDEQAAFAALGADVAVVVAYGLILPRVIISAPKKGCFNIHASLLPRWRGAAPIQRAIMAGDRETGISIMHMAEGLDTGPVCLSTTVMIEPGMTAGALHDRLAELGARLMADALARLAENRLICSPQAEAGVTYARKVDKAETRIDFGRPAEAVRNHIHGLSPHPGAWFALPHQGRALRVKALACEVAEGTGAPGTVLDDRLTIACGTKSIRMLTVQREGKAAQDAKTFLRGLPVPAGSRLP
jgi:methionyl-tRNA formyltransferase